jgi:hypothetical protein
MVHRIVMFLFVSCIVLHSMAQVVTSTTPLATSLNLYSNKYQVTVIQNGKSYTSYTYISTGAGAQAHNQQGNTFSYSIFSFSQPVTIEVVKLNSSATSATIRPNRLGLGKISATTSGTGRIVRFTLSKPAKLSVEFDDDPSLKDVLLVSADSLENPLNVPNTANSNVYVVTGNNVSSIPAGKQIIYFTPGLHTIGYWNIPSTITQIYMANGSFVRGYFYVNRGDIAQPGLLINGRGILSEDIYPYHNPVGAAAFYASIQIIGGHDHTIEGITITGATCNNILLNAPKCYVRNVNVNGFELNNDAITTGNNVCVIDNCFFHVNDDCLVLYGANLTITNCVIWQLPGGSIIQLGWRPNLINGTNVIDNIDVIHADWTDTTSQNVGFINAMNILPGSISGLVENFTVSNIYFDTNILRFLDIRMKKNGVGQPGNFNNFTFKNIHILSGNSSAVPLISLSSYDATHTINGFTFQSIYINNQQYLGAPFNNDFVTTDQLTKITFR